VLERHPWVAKSLVDAFAKAKEIGIKHVSDARRSFLAWYGAELEESRKRTLTIDEMFVEVA